MMHIKFSENIKDYIYMNYRLIDNIFSQIDYKNIFRFIKFKFGINIKIFEASVENEIITNKKYHEKIKIICNYFSQKEYFKEPFDNLIYTPNDYYCIEKQQFIKISLENSKIKTNYNINKINFYISTDRSFSTLGNVSPLFLLPDNLNENISSMDGSSGYSIFRLLMNDYLECSDFFIRQITDQTKIDFANNPIKYFKELGCFICLHVCISTLYCKYNKTKS
jgi:hypothetical protein